MAKAVRRCFKKQKDGKYKVGKMCNPLGSVKKFASGKEERKLEVVKKRKLQIVKPRTAAQKAASRKSSAAYRARKKAEASK